MSEPLSERLRRLRREGTSAAAPALPAAPEPPDPGDPVETELPSRDRLPIWLAHRLRTRSGSPPASDDPPGATDPARRRTVGPPAALVEEPTPHGSVASRHLRLEPSHRHGAWRLEEAHAAEPDALALLGRDPRLAEADLARAVYLDVETTGLSGGAGTTSFLVALGRFEPDGSFLLWQGFLPGPEDERALLAEVAERVRAASLVVSFFGKSFDRHRLEDKMRLHGVAPPFAELPHLDLYHPLVRLYRDALPDGRLQTMERALCGVAREHDLPGSFAPEAWFDFLAGRAHRLEEVFRHNADDVVSLVVLAAHLGRTLVEERASGEPLDGPGCARARALARLLAQESRHAEALRWLSLAEDRPPAASQALCRELALLRGRLEKRTGAVEAAGLSFQRAAGDARDELAVRALVELAKLAEHELGDLRRAAEATRRAAAILPVAAVGAARARLERDLERRAARLALRLGRGPG